MPPLSIISAVIPLAAAAETPVSLAFASTSVFIGVVALLAAIYQTRHLRTQAEALRQQVSRFETTERALTDAQTTITQLSENTADLSKTTLAAIQLPQHTSKTPDLLPRVSALTTTLSDLLPSQMPFFSDYIDNRLTSLIVDAERANSGSVEINVVDLTDEAIALFELAQPQEKVFTTSYVDTDAFWHTPAANNYLQTNRTLIRDKEVDITRVFMFDTVAALEKSEPEMDKQVAAGIHVKTVLTGDLPGDLRRDMFVLGDRLAAQFDMTNDRQDFLTLRVWHDKREVNAFMSRMARMLQICSDYPTSVTDSAGTAVAVSP